MNAIVKEEVAELSKANVMASASPYENMIMMAVQQNFDLDKIERLIQIHKESQAEQARKAFISAMADFKRNAPRIYKDKHVSFNGTSYDHATLGSICEIVDPCLAACGLAYNWSTEQFDSGAITVTCTLSHELGYFEVNKFTAMPDNSGKKNAIQQSGSAITYGQRYTLLGVLGMSAVDKRDDDDGIDYGKEEEDFSLNIPETIKAIRSTETPEAAKLHWEDLQKSGLITDVNIYKQLKQELVAHLNYLRSLQPTRVEIPVELKQMADELQGAFNEFGLDGVETLWSGLSKATKEKLTPFYNSLKEA